MAGILHSRGDTDALVLIWILFFYNKTGSGFGLAKRQEKLQLGSSLFGWWQIAVVRRPFMSVATVTQAGDFGTLLRPGSLCAEFEDWPDYPPPHN